jgi:hypothetical protein
MDNYQTTHDDRSQVSFYRCTLCEAEHVTSTVMTAYQLLTNQAMAAMQTGSASQIYAR